MNQLLGLSLLLLFVAVQQPTIPSVLLGTWKVGRAYDSSGPTDLNEKQLLQIEKLRLEITSDAVKVCGRNIAIKKLDLSVFTPDQFATRYRMGPDRIGLNGANITELQINPFELTHACGEFSDPGTDVIFDEHNHFAIEVDNLYYPLRRAK
jgi:hypothetical protein